MRFLSLLFSVIFFLQIAVAGDREVVTDTLTLKPSLTTKPGRDGQLKVDSADNKLKKFSSAASSWQEITGSGGGAINFLSGGDAEGQAISAAYQDTALAQPVDGVGGTGLITFAQSSTTPLSGTKSFIFSKTGSVNLRGHGRSIDFTIDNASKAKVLQVSFDYQVASGTFTAGTSGPSGTDSDMVVYLYDVTNNRLIQPSTYKLFSNTQDKFSGTFQTFSDSTSYRLIFHQALSGTNNYDLRIDNIAVSPSVYAYGTPITDWQSYTPTGSWTTNTSYSGRWRRVGDLLEAEISVNTSAAPNAVALSNVTLPPGMVMDTAKMPSSDTATRVGSGEILDGSTNSYPVSVLFSSTTAVAPAMYRADVTYAQDNQVTNTIPFAFNVGDRVTLSIRVPILGWSSSTQMSDSYDGRVITAQAYGSETVTTGTTPTVASIGNQGFTDSLGSAMTSTQYTVQSSGWYRINSLISGGAAGGQVFNAIYQNGIAISSFQIALVNNGMTSPVEFNTYLKAGDVIQIYKWQNSGGSVVLSYKFNITKIQGPSSIAATESVALRVLRNATSTLTGVSYANNTVPFQVVDDDTHGQWSSANNDWTVPASGRYSISFNGLITNAVAGEEHTAQIFIDGALYSTHWNFASTSNVPVSATAHDVKLKAGQKVRINIVFSAASSRTMNAAGQLTIVRTGL